MNMKQCDPPCPIELCEQWLQQGICAMEEIGKCGFCGKPGVRRSYRRECCKEARDRDINLGYPPVPMNRGDMGKASTLALLKSAL